MRTNIASVIVAALAFVAAAGVSAVPLTRRQNTVLDPSLTPGALCTPNDPNFIGYNYPAQIPKCQRNVDSAEKTRVGNAYNVPRSDWHLYEFDHLIPLGIGGSNDDSNLWPQPGPSGQGESGSKDSVENLAYQRLSSGEIDQRGAVQLICDWLNQNYGTNYSPSDYGL